MQDVTRRNVEPLVYLPYAQQPVKDAWVLIRSDAPTAVVNCALRAEVAALDPELPIWLGPFTLADRLAGQGNYWVVASNAALLLVFEAVTQRVGCVSIASAASGGHFPRYLT